MTARPRTDYRGDDKLLFGIILGVLAFWLFAQTTLNIAPAMAADLNVAASVMNIAVSITALFSGIFIVVVGGLADRLGRVKILMWGFGLSIVGSLLVGAAPRGALATPLLMLGRICQGLSGAFIMPASLALIKTYWDGAGRQRAVSLWSMGSWGGSGFAALFGGLMAENVGWRWIFFASAAVSALGMLMVRGTPESKAAVQGSYKFDTKGVLTFMVTMVALQVVTTQGSQIGWANPITVGLVVVALIFGALFFKAESTAPFPFVNFGLFRNPTFTGATVSNFLLNGVAGMLLVSMMLLQVGGGLSAQEAGMGGEALAKVWRTRADDLGQPHRRPLSPIAHAHERADRAVQGPRGRRLHALRPGAGLLRDALHRCCLVESPRRPGGIGCRHLQDGIISRCIVRSGPFGSDLHRAQRQRCAESMA
jgi:DHA2 family multidrug resistance protein-like MFS transporter